MEAVSPEKRRFVRRQCALPVEFQVQSASYPLKAETSDVSPCGCYVRMLSTFPVGSKVEVVLWAGDSKMSFQATVITADANVGNGIEFTGITKEQAERLQAYLDQVRAPDASSDFIFH